MGSDVLFTSFSSFVSQRLIEEYLDRKSEDSSQRYFYRAHEIKSQ